MTAGELASSVSVGFGGNVLAPADRGLSFIIHGRSSDPCTYLIDRTVERQSKLASHFGRLANRCLTIHTDVLMYRLIIGTRIFGYMLALDRVTHCFALLWKLNFNIP